MNLRIFYQVITEVYVFPKRSSTETVPLFFPVAWLCTEAVNTAEEPEEVATVAAEEPVIEPEPIEEPVVEEVNLPKEEEKEADNL